MCGICGFTGKHEETFTHNVLSGMMHTMVHRGPDGEGTYYGDGIALGFRRLAILDLKDGSQPFYNEMGNIVSICNGEIYNYRELRDELMHKGHLLNSHCDAEILVHAYEEWGENLTCHLRGMYAFVIWDARQEKMLAVRDPFGIKPFYYSMIDGCLVFASEIKTILSWPGYQPVLNEDALSMYLSFQYSVLPETFFKGIYRLMPGSMIKKDKSGISTIRYFRPELTPGQYMNNKRVTDHDLVTAISDSVACHLRSDTELGLFLSGGIDSVYLAALAGLEKAFTVGFQEEGYNEVDKASRIADLFHMKHYKYLISAEKYWKAVPEVQYMMDEPLADPSAVALYFLDRMAAREVKAVISGEGSDEIFGGYPIYHEPLSLYGYQRLPEGLRCFFSKCAGYLPDGTKGKSFLTRGALPLETRFIGNANIFQLSEVCRLLRKDHFAITPQQLLASDYARSSEKDDISRMQEIDLNYWLWGDILLKTDKMSMAHSLECRVPYLDRRVFEVASRLEADQKICGKQTKYLLRKAAAQKVPIMDAGRKKLGFPVPIRIWLKQETWAAHVKEVFREAPGSRYFDTDQLMKYMNAHIKGKADNSRKIWAVYSFLQWYGAYFSRSH